MKAIKVLVCLGVLLLGSAVGVAIDHLVGVSFKDVGAAAQLIHKVTCMLWGGVLLGIGKWLTS